MMTSKCNWSGTATTTILRGGSAAMASRKRSGWGGPIARSGYAWNDWPGKARRRFAAAGQRRAPAERDAHTAMRADAALALHVVERRQKLIVRDHAAADNEHLRVASSGRHGLRVDRASAKASSSTADAFAKASSVITSGGADLHRGAAIAHRAEHQHAFFDAAAHHVPGQIAIGLPGSGNHAGHSRHQSLALHAADLRKARLQRAAASGAAPRPCGAAFPARSSPAPGRWMPAPPRSRPDCRYASRSCCRPDAGPSRRRGRRPRQAAASSRCPCRTAPGPARCRSARSPRACRCGRSRPALRRRPAAPCAPCTTGARRCMYSARREGRAAALVGFQNHARDVLRIDAVLAQARSNTGE